MSRDAATAPTLTVQGVEIPKLGLGTWQLTGEDCVEGVRDALALGYRHIDTARMYGNEAEVGAGIAASGIGRGEIFLTTKLAREGLRSGEVREQLEDSLAQLDTGYVDLLLIHWPNPQVRLEETLAAMAAAREEGLVRNLGVSNFPAALLREALELAPVIANQVEYHPYLEQAELLELAGERDLMITAYSPFAHGELLEDPVLAEIAAAHERSPAQVALRWLIGQPRVSTIPKASSRERRAANLDVFDFELDADENARIAGLARGGRAIDPPWAPDWGDQS